jgi:hypothetical protein
MTLHDSLYYASEADVRFFNEATAGLPKRLPHEPYHCGPQNVTAFRYAQAQGTWACVENWHLNDRMSVKPRILEIGFNLGHSAACWLALGCYVHSIDVRNDDRVQAAVAKLQGKRFMFRDRNSFERISRGDAPGPFFGDLAFIDGDHSYEGVKADIEMCKKHKYTRFLFDDWYPHHGPGVQQAVFDAGLLPLAVIGSMAYCEEPSLRGFVKQPEIV